MAFTRWDYMTLDVLAPWDEAFNAAGGAGWELVAIGRGGDYRYWAVFKRRRRP